MLVCRNCGNLFSYDAIGETRYGGCMPIALAGVNLAAPSRGSADVAVVADGGQTVWSELDWGGYPVITVQAGLPVTWTLHADEEKLNGCNNALVIPEYGVSQTLWPGDNVITFTPETEGTVAYSCWMGMIRSAIRVVGSLEE